jgi:hypothetical protein
VALQQSVNNEDSEGGELPPGVASRESADEATFSSMVHPYVVSGSGYFFGHFFHFWPYQSSVDGRSFDIS